MGDGGGADMWRFRNQTDHWMFQDDKKWDGQLVASAASEGQVKVAFDTRNCSKSELHPRQACSQGKEISSCSSSCPYLNHHTAS